MFDVGDYIVYGVNGVCKVEKVGTVSVAGISKDKMYYTLVPVYSKGSKVFTPTDNQKVVMRSVISREEALTLVDSINEIEMIREQDDRMQEVKYKESLKKCDCKECIRIIKTLYLKKQTRIAEGKKITAGDEKYLHIAEENLYGELAIPLEMEKNDVEAFISARVELLKMA